MLLTEETSVARKIRKAYESAIRALRSNEDSAVSEVLSLLKTLHDEIRNELRQIPEEKFAAFHLRRLNDFIEKSIRDFERRATDMVGSRAQISAQLGAKYWDDLRSLLNKTSPNFAPVSPILSDQLIAVIKAMPTELIRGLSDEVRSKTQAALQRAVLGAQTPFETARQLSTIIGPRGDIGAGAAAERIVRTEMGRAYAAADDLVAQKINDTRPEDLPPLKKFWVATLDDRVRPEHLDAHKQVRDFDEPFDVGGEQLDYPKDPNGSPGNTINCRCDKIVVPEDLLDDMLSQFPG